MEKTYLHNCKHCVTVKQSDKLLTQNQGSGCAVCVDYRPRIELKELFEPTITI